VITYFLRHIPRASRYRLKPQPTSTGIVNLACSVPIGTSGIAVATANEKPDVAVNTIQANILFILQSTEHRIAE